MNVLEDIGFKSRFYWPKYDETALEKEIINIVVQINGKLRSILKVKKITEQKKF